MLGEVAQTTGRRVVLTVALVLLGCLAAAPVTQAQDETESSAATLSDLNPYPLKPPNLDSPRATLQSFLKNINTAIKLWREEAEIPAVRRAARRALLCLDLSEVPLATREAIGTEKLLQLKEILDRIEIPPFEEIPDATAVAEQGLTAWTIPNTELTIASIKEGPRSGAFVFSAHTVALLKQFYELAESLPYKRGASIGVYEDYLYGPGLSLRRTWIERLPDWSQRVVADQTLWQWAGLGLVMAVVIAVLVLVYRCATWWDNKVRDFSLWARVGKPLTAVSVMLAMPLVSFVVNDMINITGVPFIVIEFVIEAITFAAAAWLAVIIITRIGEGIINARHLRAASLNSQLIRTSVRLIAIVVVIYIAVVAAENFGVPVAPLIAGLGVGGLAIALAVRPTMENIIGGFILFADRPIRVGDYCSFGDKEGTVEEIGLRSTRLRALDRTVVTVPNAEFANMQLVNWASCDRMLIETTIGLRYETKAEQLRYVLAKLREMLFAHPKIDPDTMRVRFVGFGASSQDVRIRIYAMTRDWNEWYAIQEDVLLRVSEIIEESGTSFAFPSQTLYVGRDEGLDAARSAAAQDQVERWRKTGELPFPRMAPEQRGRLANTLDYPPRGSPDAVRPQGLAGDKPEPLSSESEPDPEEENREQR